MNNYQFREAQSCAVEVARIGNKYLTEKEPWKKYNAADAGSVNETRDVLINCFSIIAKMGLLFKPFIPRTADKIFNLLNISADKQKLVKKDNMVREEDNFLDSHKIKIHTSSVILFQKIEDEPIEKQIQKLHDKKVMNNQQTSAAANETLKEQLAETTFDDFSKMDIRVATILEAERVPKTDKLLKLLLDTGIDKRTVVSGIAAFYDPEKIIGQKVVMLANLAPRKIKGIESKGMILMAENEKGELSFISPQKDVITNGSTVK